ncbi:hypothetical protein EVC27_099 [Rhizobium phage RHph_I1_6]|uniref:Uncharacterized protein n=1 Tax=Rhizobium phage RHph_I1_6 TaxID=2509728 RepID=A0A7S5RIX2_9CAUD|nr:hypothetical protein PP745_gp092 [Rhizobium phage RHph_I1_6]QIG76621.1 hypothetical protein EVC27_099 [Rhizobium phage RHph_I1_6]
MAQQMKEPSELDVTLVRDLAFKMRGASIQDGVIYFTLPVRADLIKGRIESLIRIVESYPLLSNEITRLVLEKHQRD